MKKLFSKEKWNNFKEWLSRDTYKNWKLLFLILSIVLAVFVTLFFEWSWIIFSFSAVASLGLVWSNDNTATIPMSTTTVAWAWGFINYALFFTIASVCCFSDPWGVAYFAPLWLATSATALFIPFIPKISYRLKLNEQESVWDFYDNCRVYYNGSFFYWIIIFFCCGILGFTYDKPREDRYEEMQLSNNFDKQYYHNIIEYHTESRGGEFVYTIYVVKCDDSTIIGVDPRDYPDIRHINENSQIKFSTLNSSKVDGLTIPKKLEIKN